MLSFSSSGLTLELRLNIFLKLAFYRIHITLRFKFIPVYLKTLNQINNQYVRNAKVYKWCKRVLQLQQHECHYKSLTIQLTPSSVGLAGTGDVGLPLGESRGSSCLGTDMSSLFLRVKNLLNVIL